MVSIPKSDEEKTPETRTHTKDTNVWLLIHNHSEWVNIPNSDEEKTPETGTHTQENKI